MFKMAQKVKVEPDMATYWFQYSNVPVFNHKIALSQLFMCPVEFDRPQNRFKMAQKVKVKPDMATYSFSTVMYKYLITK